MSNLRNTVQFLNIIQLVNYIRTFLFSYSLVQDRLDRKKTPNKHCYNWQWTLLIKRTPGGSFILMASYAPVPFSLYLQQEKTQKAKTPKPCFTQLHYWVPQEGKCQRHLYDFYINYIFLKRTRSKGCGFFKAWNFGFPHHFWELR